MKDTFSQHKSVSTIDINRKGSIVRERCRQLCEMVVRLNGDGTIYYQDLIGLVQDHIGADKETLRSYMGYNGHIRKGRNENVVVGFSRKGYLTEMGFMHKLQRGMWTVNQTVLLSHSLLSNTKYESVVEVVHQNLSLSASVDTTVCLVHGETEENSTIDDTTKIHNNNNSERKINLFDNKHIEAYQSIPPVSFETPELIDPHLLELAKAVQLDSEPDKARVKWKVS